MRVLRYLVTGGIGLSVNLGVFRLLHVFGVFDLAGSVVAFLLAMFVGFVLQKYWTFEDRAPERMHTQLALYATLALCNLVVNTGIVYLLIAYTKTYYLVAQTVGAAVVALVSYFIYRRYIFNERAPET